MRTVSLGCRLWWYDRRRANHLETRQSNGEGGAGMGLSMVYQMVQPRSGRNSVFFFFFQAEDGIRDLTVTGVQTCALPISHRASFPTATMADRNSIRDASRAC